MPHLSPDRLAELADSEPTAAERQHLDACATCAAERSAHRRVLTVAHLERDRLMPPLVTWDTLSVQLRAEGLIKPQASTVTPRLWATGMMRAAAALLFVTGGVAVGRYTAGAPVVPAIGVTSGAVVDPVAGRDPFRSTDEAVAALNDAQQTYQRAAAFLAAKNTDPTRGGTTQTARRSLAALDEITAASRAALWQAPDDPRVNQIYLQSLGAREQALHQLGNVLPVNVRLTSY